LPVYDVNTDTTSIVAASAIFNSGMVGMAFYPDSTSRNAYEIVGYVSSTNIIVAGNVNKVDDLGTTMQVCRRGIITEESGRVLLDVDAAFTSPMAGWRVELNLEKSAILNLGGYVSGSKMQLQGDPLFLADLRTERYHIAAPPGVCGPNTGTSYSATGATADPRDRNKANASNPGSRYLWAGYMYLTPIVGVWTGSSIQGSQSGINKLGQYHCWNRTYDVSTGRWTTPDPAASPWRNLLDYVGDNPIGSVDATGLAGPIAAAAAAIGAKCLSGVLVALAVEAIASAAWWGNFSLCRSLVSAIAGCAGGVGGPGVAVIGFLTSMAAKARCNQIDRARAQATEDNEGASEAAKLKRARNRRYKESLKKQEHDDWEIRKKKCGYPEGGGLAKYRLGKINKCIEGCDEHAEKTKKDTSEPGCYLHHVAPQISPCNEFWGADKKLDWDEWKAWCHDNCKKTYVSDGQSYDDIKKTASEQDKAKECEAREYPANEGGG